MADRPLRSTDTSDDAPSRPAPHGVLVIDKPEGPTSHDVVGRVRRVLRERRVGHAGTLDPLASGVVVVLVGAATRLSPYLTGDDKRYRAAIRLGFATATYDREGEPLPHPAQGSRPLPADVAGAVAAAIAALAGTRPQTPPPYSAKKIEGERAHRLARRGEAVAPPPAIVTLRSWRLVAHDGDTVTVDLETSAGFYVRSLAHDVGAAIGCGAHLASLRRTGSGPFSIADAIPLPPADAPETALRDHLRPLDALLPDWPAAVLAARGVERVGHGALLGPDDCTVFPAAPAEPPAGPSVRLLDGAGRLLALAAFKAGRLHPSVVLRPDPEIES